MTSEGAHGQAEIQGHVTLPAPTIAPLVVSLGLTLMAAGMVTSPTFLVVGGAVLTFGMGLWVSLLLPGRGHVTEAFVAEDARAKPPTAVLGTVEPLRPGMPGYRFRLPERVHPISAGIRGGTVGGLIMPLPALAYGFLSSHGLWYPINLLAGMVLSGVGRATTAELERFHVGLLVLGLLIHAAMSVVVGTLYGVLLPTLPDVPKALAWGGLLMPLLWTGTTFGLMRLVNPLFYQRVDWPWFILSQFLFGLVAAIVVGRSDRARPLVAGLIGGLVGGLIMPLPALLWGLLSGRGAWYPVNLLAMLVHPRGALMSVEQLSTFHADWLLLGSAMHMILSLGFGAIYGLVIRRVPPMPAPIAWGSLLMPLVWTTLSFSLMGVVNPLLQQRVDWPWFVVSQFIFGLAASIVVVRSERIEVPPAGPGPARLESPSLGPDEGRS